MKEKLLALLVAKFLGVSKATLERIAEKKAGSVSDESQLQSVADSIDFGQVLQSEVDAKITDSNKKAIQNYESKHKLKDGQPVEDPPAPPVNPTPPVKDEPEWFKSYREAQEQKIKDLEAKNQERETKEKLITLKSSLKTKLGEKKIPESYWSKRNLNVESDEQLDALVTEIESDYTAFKQELVDSGVVIDKPVDSGGAGGDEDSFISQMKDLNTKDE
jgi:hypothetical protein